MYRCIKYTLPALLFPLVAVAANILFVGNSFTHGDIAPVKTYNAAAITDANGTGYGGVPGIFKKLATEGGFAGVNVTIEAVSSQTLAYHHANKAAIIGQPWDWVVLQEYSTRPLSTLAGADLVAFRQAVQNLDLLVRQQNASARVLLYETWARPDQVPANYASLQAMQNELQDAYSSATTNFRLHSWVPVGDAFMQALDENIAYDPDAGPTAGEVNLWAADNYHASAYGSYLSALLFYTRILGGDPRLLPTGAGSAVAALGLNASIAADLQQIAYQRGLLPSPVRPGASSVFAGSKVTLKVDAVGAGATYQWRLNGANISGATSPSFSLTNFQAANAGSYDVVVSQPSAKANLSLNTTSTTKTILVDFGSASSGYPTPSPDSSGRHWNQITDGAAETRLGTLLTSSGATHPSATLAIVSRFNGMNTAGVNSAGPYPATAQRDSIYVNGSAGPLGKGHVRLYGLNPLAHYTLKMFASRAATGARVTRYSVDSSPVHLDAVNNTTATVSIGPIQPDAAGTLTLSVEPYNAAGMLQEYGYLGVLEITEQTPGP